MHTQVPIQLWRSLAVLFLLSLLALPAFAQTGFFNAIVYDDRGEPLRGATLRAENSLAYPRTLTTTSDQRGRIALVGLRSGQWTFTVEYPGFQPTTFPLQVRSGNQNNRPILIRLERIASLILGGPLAGVDVKLLKNDLAVADQAYAKGSYDAAIEGYRTILSRAPALTLVNLQIGNAYRQKGDTAKAVEAYAALLKAEPGNASALYQLAEIRRSEGQLDAARDLYEKALTSDPSWTKPILRLGMLASEKGDSQTAVAQLKKVVAMDPQSPEATEAESLLQKISR